VRPRPYPGAALLAWLRIVKQHGGVSARKLHHALPWLLRYLALGPSRIYESFRYDRLVESHTLPEDPIFVLGHWRSGTSFLQELLSLDERFATCSLFQCLFPECMLSTRRWLPGFIDGIASSFGVRYPIQDRPLRASLPAEEEIAMLCMTDPDCSNWGQIFPTRMRRHIPLGAADGVRWLDGYDYVVKKLSVAHDGRRLVLKSPMNTARVALLQSAYPGAVFVHIHRHPLDVFASTCRLWDMILRQSAMQHLTRRETESLILDVYELVMRRYLDERATVEPSRLVEVSYEELKADPSAVMAAVYDSLRLGDAPTDGIGNFVRSVPAPSARARSADPALERQVRERWEFAFAAWGYD